MRLLREEFNGLTCFSKPVVIDYEQMGPGLIAIVGRTGAGKTTCAEAVYASLFRSFATRPGSIYDHCGLGQAYIETTWVADNGETVRVRLVIDADKRKTEGYVFVDDEAVTSGKLGPFSDEIERYFGSSELFLASVFAAQDKSGNFLGMVRSDRMALFAEMLRVGYLDALSVKARDRGAAVQREVASKAGAVVELQSSVERLDDLRSVAELKAAECERLAGEVETGRQRAAAASAELVRAEERSKDVEGLEAALLAASGRVASCREATEAIAERGRVARESFARERRAVAERRSDALHAAADRLLAETVARLDRRDAKVQSRILTDAPTVDDLDRQEAALNAELIDIDTAEDARGDLLTAAGAAKGDISRIEVDLSRLRAAMVGAESATSLLGDVPCTAVGIPVQIAGACPLLSNAVAAEAELPALRSACEAAEDALKAARAASAAAEKRLTADPSAARLARRKAISEEQRVLARNREMLRGAAAAEADMREIAAERVRAVEHHLEAIGAAEAAIRRDELDEQRIERQIRLSDEVLGDEMVKAKSAWENAKLERDAAEQRVADTRATTAAIEALRDRAESAAKALQVSESELRTAERTLATLQAEIATLSAAEVRLAELAVERDELLVHLGDWGYLTDGLGKRGAPALEVDAAGPEVAELANDLLRTHPRKQFSIAFETLREKISEAGEYTEVFDVKVFDGGAERRVESLSGGQKVIVGEAISLALAIYNSKKNDVRYRTIIRDETAGALDPKSASAYVLMLRRALELGGFHQCIFIAHSQEVYEAADVQVYVDAGSVSTDDRREAA